MEVSSTLISTPNSSFSYAFSNLMNCSGTPEDLGSPLGINVLSPNMAYASPQGDDTDALQPTAKLPRRGRAARSPLYGARRSRCGFRRTAAPELCGQHSSMTTSDDGRYYVITDYDSGTVYQFDIDSGLLYSTSTAGGQQTVNTIEGPVGGQYWISETSRTVTYSQDDKTVATTESLFYDYYPAGGPNAGMVQYVTLARTDATPRRRRPFKFAAWH